MMAGRYSIQSPFVSIFRPRGPLYLRQLHVTGIALIEAALGDMAGILREIRGELKPAEPSDELTVPDPPEGIPALRRCSSTAALELAIRPGRNPCRRAESPEQLPRHWKPSVRYSWGIPHGFTPFVCRPVGPVRDAALSRRLWVQRPSASACSRAIRLSCLTDGSLGTRRMISS